GASTPTVTDYAITYNNSDTPPTNPIAVNAFSQVSGGISLTSGQTYLYEHPSFNFIGASSPEAGIAGYYVYFGTNSNADPVTDGSFQETANYEVNTEFDAATYYLRIKTKDNNGNISTDVFDGFTYAYNGVAPALIETKTTQGDFSAGTLSDVSATDVPDALRLNASGGTGFWNQSRMTNAPAGMYYGSDSVQVNYEGNDYIFALRGGNTTGFYRYALATDTWTAMKVTPAIVGYGGSIEAGPDGFLYATQGGNLPTFWKYEIATDIWTAVSSAPKNFYIGGSLSYDGSRYIYGLPGSDDAFYRYDIESDSWTVRANAQFGNPNTVDGQMVGYDSDSVYDGRNNIYVTKGVIIHILQNIQLQMMLSMAKLQTLGQFWLLLQLEFILEAVLPMTVKQIAFMLLEEIGKIIIIDTTLEQIVGHNFPTLRLVLIKVLHRLFIMDTFMRFVVPTL
ncbi:MAG: hypothetical protein US25_C0001G0016, partial [Candidatus Moranbacteria bacterium GW2011_GWE1_36_7]